MKMLRRLLPLALALLLVASAAGCSRATRTVCRVGDFDVSFELYRYVAMELRYEYDGGDASYWAGKEGEARLAELKNAVESVLCQYAAVLSLCETYEISLKDAFVEKQVNEALESSRLEYNGASNFRKELKKSFMTENVWRFLEGAAVCQDEVYYAMLKKGVLTGSKEEMTAFFESDELIRIKQILIDPSRYDSEEDARRVAEEVHRLALDGADFDSLVTKYGNDLFMFKNTDGYYMMRGTRFEAFENAAFSLSVGQISEVTKTPAGYSILLRLEKDPSYLQEHFSDLVDDYADAQFSLSIEKVAASLSVSYEETPDLLQLSMD